MAGLILVKGPIDEVPEIAAARDELLAIQNLKMNPLDGDSRDQRAPGPQDAGFSPAAFPAANS
jgi:hypothetical protein